MVKNLPAFRRCRFDPWVRKIPWRKAWQLTPIFLPGESHGQRSLVGYSPCVAELDTTEVTKHNVIINIRDKNSSCLIPKCFL